MQITPIVEGFVNKATGGYDKDEALRRLTLCRRCKLFIPYAMICNPDTVDGISGCGCFLQLKVTQNTKLCEHNVWTEGHTELTLNKK